MTSTVNQIIIGDNKLDFGAPITKTTTSGFKVFDLSTVLGSTFSIGTTGTSPNWTNVGTAYTLNIPFANTSGVTSGLLSNTEYLSFKNERWTTLGNSGTVQATNFLGTIDNVGLSFRTNNVIRQTIDNTGKIGIGITTPNYDLHINGDVSLNGANQFLRSFTTGGLNTKLLGITLANKLHIGGIDQPLTSIMFTNNGTHMMEMLPNGNIGLGVANPNSRLQTFGSISTPYLETTNTGYFPNDGDDGIILTNTVSQTVNTPTASTTTGRLYTIVNPTLVDKVFSPAVIGLDGVNTTVIGAGMSYIIKSTGTAWRIISQSVASVTIPDASPTVSGKVNTTSQHFAGTKYFDNNIIMGSVASDSHLVRGNLGLNNSFSIGARLITNQTVSGNVATQSVIASTALIFINQTTPNISLSLPALTALDASKLLFVQNSGTVSVQMNLTDVILPNRGLLYRWTGSVWQSFNYDGEFPLIATTTATLPTTYKTVICQNGATNITLTLPDPSLYVGKIMNFTRDPASTGTITLTNSGTARIQALNGTVGATTSIAALGANETWNSSFIATNTSLGYAWLRIS